MPAKTGIAVNLASSEAVLRAVRDIIGARPSDWLVIIGTHDGAHVMTAHYFLHYHVVDVFMPTVSALIDTGVTEVALVYYVNASGGWEMYSSSQLRQLQQLLKTTLAAWGLDVKQCLLVHAGRWYDYFGADGFVDGAHLPEGA